MAGLFQKVKNEDSYQKYFKDGEKFAKGGFGLVYPVINRETGKVIAAIKRVDLEGRDKKFVAYSRREVCLLDKFE